ncbi:MAG: GNAT family N-acetyltransferase [Acidobacteriota bacterium]
MRPAAILVLLGPKGAGKSFLGRLMESELSVSFIDVESIFLSLDDPRDVTNGYERVADEVAAHSAGGSAVSLELTGASEHADELIERLRGLGSVRLVRVDATLSTCLRRVRDRDASVHLPADEALVETVHAACADSTRDHDLTIDNDTDDAGRPLTRLRRLVEHLAIGEGRTLSSYRHEDAPALVEALEDGTVAATIPVIPHPYGLEQARSFLRYRIATSGRHDVEVAFALRDADDRLIGSVGLEGFETSGPNAAELGYWIGPRHWGQGLTGAAVPVVLRHAFETLALERVNARTLVGNQASRRILDRNGFQHVETRLKDTPTRDGPRDTSYHVLEQSGWLALR